MIEAPIPAMVSAAFVPELPPERIDFPHRIPALVMDTFVPGPTERLDSPLALVLAVSCIPESDLSTLEIAITL
jgi:hypothetical protein